MPPLSSSTFSSETPPRRGWLDAAATLGWTLAALAGLDLAAGRAFRPPSNPRVPPSSLQAYFDYGRSLEGKLDRMIGPTDKETAPICFAGWPEPALGRNQPTTKADGADRLIAFYGMSFTNHIGEAVAKLDPRFTVRLISGPAAPASFAYAAFGEDRDRQKADAVVLGILDSSVVGMFADNGMTWNFLAPQPFFYPGYQASNDGLTRHDPPFRSFEALRSAWLDPARRRQVADDLRAWDAFYSPFFFEKNALDSSTIARLIRRALFRSHFDRVAARCQTRDGFVPDSPPIRALRAIVAQFAAEARSGGKRPIVLMIQDGSSGGRLQTVLGPVLNEHAIPSLNTNAVCPTADRSFFIADGHFTPEGDRMIARALIKLLDDSRPAATAR